MSKRMMVVPVVLLAFLPGAALAGAEDKGVAQEKLDEVIKSIPIQRVPTTREQREAQRKQGVPVMTVKGQPGYLYRDFLQATVADTWAPLVTTPVLKVPQENPDVYGCVKVSFEIRPDGKTDAFEVVKSEPAGIFDEHALRAIYATEYEPTSPAPAAAGPAPRRERSIWFLVARPPRVEFSRVNSVVEKSRNKRREELRAACEDGAA